MKQWTDKELKKIFDRHAADIAKIENQYPTAVMIPGVDIKTDKPCLLVVFDEAQKGQIDVSGIPKTLGKGKDKIDVKIEWMPPVIAF